MLLAIRALSLELVYRHATDTKETNISNKHNIALKDPIWQDYTDTSTINHLAMLPPACRVELCLFCCTLLCCALMCFEMLCCCIVLYFVQLCFFLLFCFVLLLFVCVLVVTIKWQVHVCWKKDWIKSEKIIYQIQTVTSLSVCRIAVFTLVWSQSLVHGLYVDHQDTITDVHFVTDLTDDRRIGAFWISHSGDLVMNSPNVSV